MMNLIQASFVWFFIIQVFLMVHFYIIEYKDKNPNHTVSFVIAFILGSALSWVMFDTILFKLLGIPYLGLMYWILFPMQQNFFMMKPLLYQGDPNNKKGSKLDRFERRFKNPGALLGLKIVLMIMLSFVLLDLKY